MARKPQFYIELGTRAVSRLPPKFTPEVSFCISESGDRQIAFDRIDAIAREYEVAAILREGKSVRYIASVQMMRVLDTTTTTYTYTVHLYRASQLMTAPSLYGWDRAANVVAGRFAELAWGWDTLMNAMQAQERMYRLMEGPRSHQLALRLDVMLEMMQLWTCDNLHLVKTHRFEEGRVELAHPQPRTVVTAVDSLQPLTCAYLQRRYPGCTLTMAALQFLEEGVRELSDAMSSTSPSPLQAWMDVPGRPFGAMFRGFPLPSAATFQLGEPSPLFTSVFELTALSTVAAGFIHRYGLPGDIINSLQIVDDVSSLPMVPVPPQCTNFNELEFLACPKAEAPLRVVAITIVANPESEAPTYVHYRSGSRLVPGALANLARQSGGPTLVVLLLSTQRLEEDVAHERMKAHCQRLWGR